MNVLKKLGITALLLGTLSLSLTAETAEGLEISHLGVSNTLVRIKGNARYLLMPVQEANDDATVNVLVDGNVVKTLYVRLAKSKVDYSVPLDISKYAGHDVILNIVTSQNRSTVREAKDDACWKDMRLSDTFDTANREKYRPAYHHTPLYGWMNDPNGMVWKDGVWHLYYQYNPYGSKWQNMTWGHSSSKDLLNWTRHAAAIEPNGLGSVFSGSAVVDKRNTAGFGDSTIVALYTSAGVSQIQSLAWSKDDGETFNVYPGNPVITLESEARDPNVFYNESTKEWNLLLAHALEHEMLFFSSPDLKKWTLRSRFGKGAGAQDGVWECPDLFPLNVNGSGEKKWVLLCNINPGGPYGGSATQYFTGDFDGTAFTPDKDADGNVPTKWMDYGKDHYATVSWSDAPDGRRTVIGWMSNWQYAAEVPTRQFRSANTLPRDVGLFKGSDGQFHLSSSPSPEVTGLRGKLFRKSGRMSVSRKARTFALPSANDGICEILVDLAAKRTGKVTLTFSNDAGEKVVMNYDVTADTLSFDRRNSGITDFSHDFPAVTAAPAFTSGNRLGLRIFIDRSSMEVFEKSGKFAMTNLVFPTSPYKTLTVSCDKGHAQMESLTIYTLDPTE
ncbi:MAG: DUF4980 domain-containing protein [Bacteroidales bacterium]|nr:DUF4980 domain-containing protein [Bacteroidales bacterium]MCM1146544.1 DUF4980 domain-containing protein [Bacteroidales bacterium]MCM1205936.1 DUF4980 domain-containing protein [Bacillota bacterium]MCM1510186.1 DUF4980 domain-containing protein [Clostridium sp.]